MKYKVCILAAGKGTRLSYAENYSKALIPVGEKSTLSRIIEKFPKNIEIILAVGYNAEFIEEFIKIAFPDRQIKLVYVNPYEGPGSGPGYSLYSCREYLQCPFICTSSDTIVLEPIPEPTENWLGIAKADDPETYCMAEVYNGLVKKFYNKVPMAELLKHCQDPKAILNSAFIGITGIHDFKSFWAGFENKEEQGIVEGEIQVMDGLRPLTQKRLVAKPFTWFDTGNDLQYYFTNQYFDKLNLLTKKGEFIYFEDGKVVKYFANPATVKNRIHRADLLKGIVPTLCDRGKHFYAYRFLQGETLNKVDELSVFKRLLEFCIQHLWQPIKLSKTEQKKFDQAVHDFYFTKTQSRLEAFYRDAGVDDKEEAINGVNTPKLSTLLKRIDWKTLCQGKPVLFHGDLQPENILVQEKGFTLLDWRQDFGGLLEHGDIYYDFAKLYHAMIISNEVIRKNEYRIVQGEDGIHLDYLIKSNLWAFKEAFETFLEEKGYDLQKVKILTALVFLNIAPLSHYPYNVFVYYLGKSMLNNALNLRQK